MNLRNLTRQHENLTGIFVQTKFQFKAVLDQVFPEYRGAFGDLYSVISLLTLLEYPTSNDVLEAGEEALAAKIDELCKSRSSKWAVTLAKKLISASARNLVSKPYFNLRNVYQNAFRIPKAPIYVTIH